MLMVIVLGGGVGWLMGVAAFFQASLLRAEVRALREAVARSASAGMAPQAAAAPADVLFAPMDDAGAARRAAPPAPPGAEGAGTPARPHFADLEALITMRWGVWLGAAALLFAGVFLVRYAAEQGLLGPASRCVLAALLGMALLAAAELLQRRAFLLPAGPFRVDQAPPGLAAGGVAILLGAAYGAGPYYGFLPPMLGFAAMAAAAGAGMAASLRFGQLTAAIGVAGAFITPALVATASPSLPGLFAYLFAVAAASLYIVRRTAWLWLGWANIAACAVWVCIAAGSPATQYWAAGAFVPASVILVLTLIPAVALDTRGGKRLVWCSFAILAASGLLLESIQGGNFVRAAVLLLSPIAVWKGRAEPRLDRLPWLGALAGLLVMLFWALPAWTPSPAFTGLSGFIEAMLPGTWQPQVIRPLLITAAVFAAFNLGAGLALERKAPSPLNWSALAAATPVLVLAVVYAQIERFQTDGGWAMAAAGLAALLAAAAGRARRAGPDIAARQCAGIYAAGAIAALALGCAMLLHQQWLTLAIAMFLPALPWIEARADLPALRFSALAVGAVIAVRLLLNGNVLFYDYGVTPILNGLIAAYAAPALAFGVAAVQFRRRRDDFLVAFLEAGAVALGTCFVALEIRHALCHGDIEAPARFAEFALQLISVSAEATALLYLTRRKHRPVLRAAAAILGAAALALGSALILYNPAFTGASTGVTSLALAYLVPPAFALAARRQFAHMRLRIGLMVYAAVSWFAWITLQVRESFHPGAIDLSVSPVGDAELWAWSGAWLLYSSALMIYGIRQADRVLRTIALVGIGLVCAKVFLIDMAQLAGLWRVFSFLGLGLALIGLGALHRRLVVE